MDVLDELTDRFMDELDTALCSDIRYTKTDAELHDFIDGELSPDKASELNEIVGKLTSALFNAACKTGMKLGARITAGLLKE